MALTPAQLTTLGAYIATVPAWNSLPNNSDTAYFIAGELNKDFAPKFTVWKTSVPSQSVGEAMNSTEVAGLTTANTSRLQVMVQYSGGFFNPSRADTRAGFDSVFSGAGGALTRAAMLALWKRAANHVEKLFATGTGSDASPATMVFEGVVSYQEVEESRRL